MNLLWVCLGGAVGSGLRYLIDSLVPHGVLISGTFVVNLIGSFLLGVFVATIGEGAPDQLRFALTTGLMGGFTTYSTFSLEAFRHFEGGAIGHGALYIALTVGACLLGTFLGLNLGRVLT